MRTVLLRLAALVVVVASTACGPFIARPRADEQIITHQEMQANRFITAYDAVMALHSNWLNVHPKSLLFSQPVVVVYVDVNRYGYGAGALKDFMVRDIQYIRHYTAVAATERWGIGHTEGAIQISTQAQ